MYPDKQVMVRPRQAGKTNDALKWVFGGERCKGYPGWTRVLIAPSVQMETYMRRMACPSDIQERLVNQGKELPTSWWQAMEDWSHRVYALEEFRNGAHGFRPASETEWCIDDFDLCLSRAPHVIGEVIGRFKVTRLILTGEDWSNE